MAKGKLIAIEDEKWNKSGEIFMVADSQAAL